jgi:hypothetical protein
MKTIRFLALACLFPAASCYHPAVTKVSVQESRPSLVFEGAPASADLYIDETLMGKAADFTAEKGALLLEKGVHRVFVTDGGRELLKEKVFLGDGVKHIDVGGR